MSANTSNYGKNTFLYMLAMVLPNVIAFIALPIYSNYIIPEELGILTYTTSFQTFLTSFSVLGLNSYYLVSYGKTEDKKILNGTMFWFLTIWNAVLLVILGLVLFFLWPHLNMSFPFFPYVFLMLVTQFFYVTDVIPMRTYRLRGEVNFYLYRVLVKAFMSFGLSLLFVIKFRMGVMGRYYAELIHNVVFAIIFISYMAKNSYLRIDKSILKESLKFGIPLVPSDVLNNAQPTINSALIERILSLSELGVYSIGAQLSKVISMITQSISLAIEPDYYLKVGRPDYNDFIYRLKNIQLVAAGWFCVGCGVFIREALYIFMNPSYWPSWEVVQSLAIAYYIGVLSGVYNSQALLNKRTKLMLIANLAGVISLFIVELFILRFVGINGVGYATISSRIVVFAILYCFVGRHVLHNMHVSKDFFMIGIACIVIFGTRVFNSYPMIYAIIAKIGVFIIYTIVLLTAYKINPNELYNALLKKKK